jgi:hypothetical protein
MSYRKCSNTLFFYLSPSLFPIYIYFIPCLYVCVSLPLSTSFCPKEVLKYAVLSLPLSFSSSHFFHSMSVCVFLLSFFFLSLSLSVYISPSVSNKLFTFLSLHHCMCISLCLTSLYLSSLINLKYAVLLSLLISFSNPQLTMFLFFSLSVYMCVSLFPFFTCLLLCAV